MLKPENEVERRVRIDWLVDILSVLLLSLTSVLSAVCIYQSGRWGGESTRSYNEASAYRINAGIATAKSNELHLIDIGMFLRYLEALHTKDTVAAAFLFERFRPEARPAIIAWVKSDPLHNRRAAPAPFSLPQYRLASDVAIRADETRASAEFQAAGSANRMSEAFLRLTIVLSTAAFLAGMSTKFRFPFHLAVVILGSIALIYSVFRMLDLRFL